MRRQKNSSLEKINSVSSSGNFSSAYFRSNFISDNLWNFLRALRTFSNRQFEILTAIYATSWCRVLKLIMPKFSSLKVTLINIFVNLNRSSQKYFIPYIVLNLWFISTFYDLKIGLSEFMKWNNAIWKFIVCTKQK